MLEWVIVNRWIKWYLDIVMKCFHLQPETWDTTAIVLVFVKGCKTINVWELSEQLKSHAVLHNKLPYYESFTETDNEVQMELVKVWSEKTVLCWSQARWEACWEALTPHMCVLFCTIVFRSWVEKNIRTVTGTIICAFYISSVCHFCWAWDSWLEGEQCTWKWKTRL